MEDYVLPDPETEIPGIERIAGIDAAEYERMVKNHRNMLAKDELYRIELPEEISELWIQKLEKKKGWLEKVAEAFEGSDDPELKEEIRLRLRTFLIYKIKEKIYPQPGELMPFTMMVDTIKKIDDSPGVVVIIEKTKWKGPKGNPGNKNFEFTEPTDKQLALLYRNKDFSTKAMATGFLFQTAFERPDAQPEPLPPLVAHQVLTDLNNDITRPDAAIHMPGTWDELKTNLEKQRAIVKMYHDRGGRDFGAVDSFTMLVSAAQEVLDLFDTTNIKEILKPPPQP
ncbi:MAG: hypothetical protein VB855_09805 [Pirellulaceae bacterium]